ncbi:hypothetical protein G6F46_013255 [Rhizopus delemar]|nr:hypothetical protein G6F48_013303 [Rhizopus delemar]KAG1606081.1 hypothetical protein G6F46_013255 [Rhizopus delemar]
MSQLSLSNENCKTFEQLFQQLYYGNKNFPQKASTSKPCRYCGRSWSHGHQCQEYADFKRKLHVDPKKPRDSDKSIYAIVRTTNDENDDDHDMTEAENHAYDCKAL